MPQNKKAQNGNDQNFRKGQPPQHDRPKRSKIVSFSV
jgi:hypothetical protein